MEEKKTMAQPKKQEITFDQLKQYYGELSQRYQQLAEQNEQMRRALESQEFNYMSFYISMLFKVMEHPEMYDVEFTEWAAKEIQDALRSFKVASQPEDGNKMVSKPEEENKTAE